MRCFGIAFNSQLNLHDRYATVRVSLLLEIKINLFNFIPTKSSRPALGMHQQQTTYAKNMYTSMVVRWVGLKCISKCFVNGFNIQIATRPTPTFIGIKQDGLL